MKVQMVCLANADVERGRALVGVLLENGLPVVDAHGPRWMRLTVDSGRDTIPKGLVIDILPRDVLEFDVLAEDRDDCRGIVQMDPIPCGL